MSSYKDNTNSNRIAKLKNALRTDHLNSEEKSSLISICKEYNHIFYLEGDQLTSTNAITCKIPLNSNVPISTKSYRYPEVHKHEVETQIKGMLDQGIIEESTSPWNSPLWVVPKKADASAKKKWRIVIDYRRLNDITIGDSFPLPNIVDILDQLGHSKYFSTIDLTSGFHQIKMDPEDSPKTAFSTPSGHYQYSRMPFGLKNAPSIFQRLMNTVLSGIQNYRCFVYLDDIVIHADTLENHNKRLKEVFEKLSTFNLKIQPDKCEFFRREVMYLGHLITEFGVKPDEKKVCAVTDFPIPRTQKDIKSFLGLTGYYRRFIKNFSALTQPLTKLLRKNVEFNWTSIQQQSFENLKSILCSEPILQYPDFTKPFVLTTDASNYAIGSILSQGKVPDDLPIAYASRTLNKAESNYSTTEKELLAIVWSVKHFRPYLYGNKFFIYTDHKPLTWLFNVKDPGSRLVRWRLALEEYSYEIIYKPGKLNQNADCLSRPPLTISETNICEENKNPATITLQINKMSKENNDTYSQFLSKSETILITNDNIKETNEKITSFSQNLALFVSVDLNFNEIVQKQINKQFSHIEKLKAKNPRLNDIIYISDQNKNFYYIFIKNNYWDNTSYEDIFNSLIKLRDWLLNDKILKICLPRITFSYDKLSWGKIRSMIRFIFRKTDISIIIYHDILTNPEPEEITTILQENHTSPTAGHSGFHRTYNRIKKHFKWNNMKNDIKNFIKTCESCQKNKLVRKKFVKPMEITTTSSNPLEKIFLDIVGPLPLTESGNKFILTLQDDLTKFSQAYAIPNHETKTIAENLVRGFICKFGKPDIIVTDQGRDFTSKLFSQIAKLFKIRHINCTAYHPESNAALERSHATLADYLKHYIKADQSDWDEWLDFAMFSYNTTNHTSTKFTPYELIFGYTPNLPSSIIRPVELKYTYEDYLDNLTLKLRKSHELAKTNLLESKVVSKKYYDQKINDTVFLEGQLVYLQNEQTKKGQTKKLTQNYNGPYKILEINSPVNCTILVNKKPIKVHMNRLKHAFVSGMQ